MAEYLNFILALLLAAAAFSAYRLNVKLNKARVSGVQASISTEIEQLRSIG